MYILNIASTIKKMSVNELRDFIFENYYKGIRFVTERSYYSMKCLKKNIFLLLLTKLIEKIPDPRMRKKNAKLVKQSEIITYEPKNFENPNVVVIKSVIIEHPKTLHKLSKNRRQAENLCSNSSSCSDKFF